MDNNGRPLYSMTVEEFVELLDERIRLAAGTNPGGGLKPANTNLVYGIRGIEQLFHVSHKTAQAYKDTFLKPAVCQNGRKIVVDRDLALKLFAEHEEKGGAR